jgi:perosamine synthetase
MYVMDALARGEISGTSGTYVRLFEEGFAKYSGCKHGVSVNSGTTALHLALVTLGIRDKDEVIISTFTNMATFFAALYQGAKPVPIDIEPDTWNIDPRLVESKITKKTKAIMVVHIYGHPVDMDPILEIARKYGLPVVEDCAEAHGATYKGKKVGSLGEMGCFSFYANKIITTGEGGMITTNDAELAEKARCMGNLAFGEIHKFMHQGIGYKYPLSNLQAALGCAQLEQIDQIIQKKREVARFYDERLGKIRGLQLPVEKEYAKNVYWMYHVVVDEEAFGLSRDELMKRLKSLGIETRESFVPYNDQEAFIRQGLVSGEKCPIASSVGRRGLYLPSGPSLTPDQLRYIAQRLESVQNEAFAATPR